MAISGVGGGVFKSKKLIILSSSGIRDVYRTRLSALRLAAKIAKVPLRVLPAKAQGRIKKKAYGALGSEAMLLPHMELTFKRLMGEDLQDTARKITIPTLIIYGTKDKDTPVKYGQLFNKAIKGSRLELIQAGHFLHQEKAEEVAGLITDFLKDAK